MSGLVNCFVNPSFGTVIKIVLDIVLYFIFATLGGYIGASSFIEFEKDKLTYHHAGLDEFDLFRSTMVFIKSILFGVLGRPGFMKPVKDPKNAPPAYVPPQKLD